MMNRNKLVYTGWVLALCFQLGCSKDPILNPVDSKALSSIVSDNLNLKMFETILVRTGRKEKVKKEGPFTLLVPSDQAFVDMGFENPGALMKADIGYLARIADFHTFEGIYDFKKMSLGYNQPVEFIKGRKYYFTRQVVGADTIIAVNGVKLLPQTVEASNGILYVISGVIETSLYNDVTEALGNANNISLFNFAVQQAGLLSILQNTKQQFTVYAPDNAAMQQLGFNTFEDIQKEDKKTLVNFVKTHLTNNFHFMVDYELQSYPSNLPIEITTLANNKIQAENVSYYDFNINANVFRVVMKGPGFQPYDEALVTRKDMVCANGIVQIINKTLTTP